MKDKSIRDTAIITITLIGGLFLLQKCSADEVKVKRDIKISQTEGHSQKDTLQESKEKHSLVDSYIKRDNEIVLASYKSASDTNDTEEKHITETIDSEKKDSNSSQNIVSTSKDINKTVETDNSKESNKTIQTLLPKVISVKDKEITLPKVVDVPQAKDNNVTKEININITQATADAPKTVTMEKIEVPTVEITIPKVPKAITSNIQVPVAVKALDIEKNELNRAIEEREKDLKLAKVKIDKLQNENKDLTIAIKENNQQIHELEEKINTALYNSDNLKDKVNKLKEELKFNQERRKKALTQKAKLESKLAIALQKNKKLETDLNSKNSNSQELVSQDHTPVETKINNLNLELNQEKQKVSELKEKNSKILNELKIKGAKLKDFDILSSKYKNLEANLTNELKSKELLLTEKTELTNKIKLSKTDLETQKSKLEERLKKLKDTIIKILIVNKEDRLKASNEYNSSIEKLQYQQKELEHNLSLELEKELSIMNEKTKLEEIVKSLEQNITAQTDEKSQLQERIDKLKATVTKMLTIAKEKGQEASVEYNTTIQQFQSKQKNLEQNLSVELEKENALADEKAKLEKMVKSLEDNITTQIDEINELKSTINGFETTSKERIAEVTEEFNAKLEAFQSQKASVEQNLSAELEKEKALADEKAKLEEMVKSLEDNITVQTDEKGQLVAKVNELKATIDNMLTTAKEETQKATQEFNSKLEALKSQKVSIEQNLSAELENEKALADEKAKLENMVKSLEQNITTQTDEKAQLVAKVDELKATIDNMLTTAKEETQKATQEFNSKLEALKSQKVSIEQNLSAELENEKALADEKAKLEEMVKSLEDNITVQTDEKGQLGAKVDELKATIDSISKMAKEETQKATQEFNAKLQALEAQKASIEENLTKQTEKLQEVMDGNGKLKEKLIQEKANFEEQLKTKESEIEKLKVEKEEAIKKEEAKHELLKTFLLTNVQFKRGSSQLTDKSKARLDDTAKKMLEYPNFKYEIQGHTDKSGKEEYNIKLSTQRAEATKKYLVSKGVPEEMLITKGFGSSQPIADNKTKEGRIKNRRVIFVIRD